MSSISIELPDEVKAQLTELSREEGVSPNELVTSALKDYFFIRKFRRLREKMMSQAPEKLTDEDVFERIS
ncbi:MAG TPA: CopG family transcriptional regulator [Gemmataceae bacterium]|nr:CopG family transcriptional regulator [Gemmataceae bacterium]